MITTPIPLETRRAVGTLTAEVETVRCALGGGWTTPAAVEAPDCAAVILGRVEGLREAVPLALVASGLTPTEINLALDALRLGLTRKEAA